MFPLSKLSSMYAQKDPRRIDALEAADALFYGA